MAEPLEQSCERLSVELLKASAALVAIIPATRLFTASEDDAASPSNKDRIVCKSSPRTPHTRGRSEAIVLVWQVSVEVCLYFTGTSANLYTLIAEIEAAMTATPNAAGFVIINASGIRRMEQTEEGDFSNEDDSRKRSKVYNFLAEI